MPYSVNYSLHVVEGDNYAGFIGYRDRTAFFVDFPALHSFLKKVEESKAESNPTIINSIHEYEYIGEVTNKVLLQSKWKTEMEQETLKQEKAQKLREKAQRLMDQASELETT